MPTYILSYNGIQFEIQVISQDLTCKWVLIPSPTPKSELQLLTSVVVRSVTPATFQLMV